MIFKVNRLLKEFYDTVKDDYPHLSQEDIADICKAPFLFVRRIIEEGILTTVHFKYFGKFLIYKGRIKGLLKSIELQKERGQITEEKYLRRKNQLQEYLNLYNEEVSETDN